jgi:PAS domain S-box-containing protein
MSIQAGTEIWRALVNYALEPMIAITDQGVIILVNQAVSKLTGHAIEDCIGLSVYDSIHPEDRDRAREVFDKALLGDAPPLPARLRLRRSDGRWLLVEGVVRCVMSADGIVGLIHARDIGRREHLEALLRHAQKLNLLGRLTASLADDFEQVVGTIRSHLPGVLERAEARPALLGLHAIIRATEKVAALTRQLRVFVDTTPLLYEMVDAHAVLEEIRRSAAGEIQLSVSLNAEQPIVQTDRSGLALGLRDLFTSLQYERSERAGIVNIKTLNVPEIVSRPGPGQVLTDYLVIEVNGHGRVSSPDVYDRAVSGMVTSTASGVTLALVILDDIVSASGGRVEVATAEHGGTAVRVFLPAFE